MSYFEILSCKPLSYLIMETLIKNMIFSKGLIWNLLKILEVLLRRGRTFILRTNMCLCMIKIQNINMY